MGLALTNGTGVIGPFMTRCYPNKIYKIKTLINTLHGSSRLRQGWILNYVKTPLINSAVPTAQGRAAIFGCCKRLKMKEIENWIFCFRALSNARDGIN
jgi:hypothetical protein